MKVWRYYVPKESCQVQCYVKVRYSYLPNESCHVFQKKIVMFSAVWKGDNFTHYNKSDTYNYVWKCDECVYMYQKCCHVQYWKSDDFIIKRNLLCTITCESVMILCCHVHCCVKVWWFYCSKRKLYTTMYKIVMILCTERKLSCPKLCQSAIFSFTKRKLSSVPHESCHVQCCVKGW